MLTEEKYVIVVEKCVYNTLSLDFTNCLVFMSNSPKKVKKFISKHKFIEYYRNDNLYSNDIRLNSKKINIKKFFSILNNIIDTKKVKLYCSGEIHDNEFYYFSIKSFKID